MANKKGNKILGRLGRIIKPKSKLDRKIAATVVALVILIGGFVVYRSLAAQSVTLLYTYQENSIGIRHTNGKRVRDGSRYVWETSNLSGYSWWGPYKDGQKAGNYRVCFAIRVVSGGYYSRVYADVRKPGAVVKSASFDPPKSGEDGGYQLDCFDYRLSSTTNDLEWRADAREGKIRIDYVRVYRING